jgi:glycosyltransferase involved in cell wall biosynthesis
VKRISVIIPTFQEEAFIGACLDSLHRQTFDRTRFEIIVSDAHSTDRTAELAQARADRVVQEDRRGIAHGRNAGARAAEGEVLLFVDADTTLAPDVLELVDRAFRDESVVGFTAVALPAGGSRFARFIYHGTYVLVRLVHALGGSFFPGICAAYRSTAFNVLGGFREDLGITEDLDLSRRIQRLGRCVVVPEATAFVSTRRLDRHAVSVVAFHILNDLRYLLTGRSARFYPKAEETPRWTDLWNSGRKDAS